MVQFEVTARYNQQSICSKSEAAFPYWTKDHVAQGFAWRPGHVSFGLPDHDGNCVVQVSQTEGLPQDSALASRSILVPLSMDVSGAELAPS
jgi:hypothetical protein